MGEVKKSVILLCVGLLLVSWHFSSETKAKQDTEIADITNVMINSGIVIDSWKISAKSSHGFESSQSGYKILVADLRNKFPEFTWEDMVYNDHVTSISASKQSRDMPLRETLTVLSYQHGNSYKTVLLYEVSGSKWKKQIEMSALDLFFHRTTDLFPVKPVIFSCAHGKLSDKMDIVLYEKAKEMMHEFDATFVEHLKEETFVSLSAYTTLWDGYLLTNDKKMNLQIALRDEGLNGEVDVSIGTPILTAEY